MLTALYDDVDVKAKAGEVDRQMEAGAMIMLPKRILASYREAAGLTSWRALAERAGVHYWHFSKTGEEEPLAGNFTLGVWMRTALAIGRHPFAVAQVIGPVPPFDTTPYEKIYRRPGAELWGWDTEEIEAAISGRKARIVVDRRKLASIRVEKGLTTWGMLAEVSGLSYPTLSPLKLNPPDGSFASTVMRISLAVEEHPFSFLRVSLPPM